MIATPHVLLERSVGDFQSLASTLAEEIGTACDGRRAVSPEARVCKELLLSISVLLPKLQAARCVWPEPGADRETARGGAAYPCDRLG